jgi:hypothetical protein
MKPDWRTFAGEENGSGRPVLSCARCGEQYAATVPCSVTILAAIFKAFNQDHKHCKAKPVWKAGKKR